MTKVLNTKNPLNCQNKLQNNLIVLISALIYINSKYKKYTPKNILYYFNENLKRNGRTPIKLKTLQNYLYKLEKEFEVTSNYYKHLGVNCGTEIYYRTNYPKKNYYQKINQYFLGKNIQNFKKELQYFLKTNLQKRGM